MLQIINPSAIPKGSIIDTNMTEAADKTRDLQLSGTIVKKCFSLLQRV